jgi:hypothetical protein
MREIEPNHEFAPQNIEELLLVRRIGQKVADQAMEQHPDAGSRVGKAIGNRDRNSSEKSDSRNFEPRSNVIE